MLRVFGIFILIVSLLGCATPTAKQRYNKELENKLIMLEEQLKAKDEQISLLEEELYKTDRQSYKTVKRTTLRPTPIRIQKALTKAGFYKGAIDGKIGQQTKEAIRAFQKANNLKVDGVVGKKTWRKLSKYLE